MRRGQLSLLALAAAGAHALAGHSVLEQESPKPIDPSPIAPGSMRTDQDPKDTFVPLSDLPPAQQWMRLFSKDCRRCVKQCMGKRVAVAQQNSLKIQAPISLITWYLFQNRPFRMWPLEDALALLTKVNPAVWVGAVAAMWLLVREPLRLRLPVPEHAREEGPADREARVGRPHRHEHPLAPDARREGAAAEAAAAAAAGWARCSAKPSAFCSI